MTDDGPSRYLDEGSPVWRFAERILVVCPRCEGLGVVTGDPRGGRASFRCTACARSSESGSGSALWGSRGGDQTATARCPACGARNHRKVHLAPGASTEVALRCECGTSHRASVSAPFYVSASPGVDPFFGLSLWLQTSVRGHLLWVWNEAHLDEVDRFVGARLRERTAAAGNASMASRLPAWMKRANAREPVRRGLEKLRARLLGTSAG